MKFRITMDVEVADHDADVMIQVPDAIQDRFAGTAMRIPHILVERVDEQ